MPSEAADPSVDGWGTTARGRAALGLAAPFRRREQGRSECVAGPRECRMLGNATVGHAPARRLLGVDDPVADAGHGLDRGGFSELAAQAAERDVNGVGEGVDVLVPYLAEEVFGAQHAILGAHQGLE
jgi:hypothetical protein